MQSYTKIHINLSNLNIYSPNKNKLGQKTYKSLEQQLWKVEKWWKTDTQGAEKTFWQQLVFILKEPLSQNMFILPFK